MFHRFMSIIYICMYMLKIPSKSVNAENLLLFIKLNLFQSYAESHEELRFLSFFDHL